MKKLIAIALAAIMVLGLLAACNNGTSNETQPNQGGQTTPPTQPSDNTKPSGTPAAGSVYYLNFKPEQDGDWKALAEAYTNLTGVPVTVLTAASGTYEETLMAEMGKSKAPTLFQVNGPVGLANWKDYCYDLSGSQVYGELTSQDFALTEDGAVYGIAYVIETYGIIYNKQLLEQAGYTQDDITNFETLKAVAEDITARKDELGFSAFTSAGMDGYVC